jgi:hypothetical protein
MRDAVRLHRYEKRAAITCRRFSSPYFGWKGHRILRGVS